MDLDLLISLAKNGDIEAQKFLLNNCKDISVPISYKYLSKAVMQGIAFEEIRELVFPAFLKALNTYRKEGILFYDYFKYLYLMEIKTAIRNRVKTNMHEIHFENIDPDSDYGNIIFHAPNFNNLIDSYSDYDKDEIYDLVIKKKVPNITEKEYKILLLFLEGLNMMEISHSIARDYSETVKSFKKAINKIKAYFRVK